MLGCNVASLESTEDTKNNQIWERKRFHRKTVYHTKCRIAITSQAYFLINSKHWSREGGCIICTVRTNLILSKKSVQIELEQPYQRLGAIYSLCSVYYPNIR